MFSGDLSTLDGWLEAREAAIPNLRRACAKSVEWAGDTGQRTPYAIVYIHGFSATKHELRPLPDLVAQGLGANLYFARLAGHGQDGPAMGRATFAQWRADIDEALNIGAALGDKVIIMGCSTGCTLITDALARGAKMAATVQISPNYGLTHFWRNMLINLPFARLWGPAVGGKTRSFPEKSPEHRAYWTLSYPTQAVYTMAQAVRAVMQSDRIESIQTPAFFAFNGADQVVSAAKTKRVMARWDGPVVAHHLHQTTHDDAMGHLMAGDIFSPQQTAPLADEILRWIAAA